MRPPPPCSVSRASPPASCPPSSTSATTFRAPPSARTTSSCRPVAPACIPPCSATTPGWASSRRSSPVRIPILRSTSRTWTRWTTAVCSTCPSSWPRWTTPLSCRSLVCWWHTFSASTTWVTATDHAIPRSAANSTRWTAPCTGWPTAWQTGSSAVVGPPHCHHTHSPPRLFLCNRNHRRWRHKRSPSHWISHSNNMHTSNPPHRISHNKNNKNNKNSKQKKHNKNSMSHTFNDPFRVLRSRRRIAAALSCWSSVTTA
mmetsp:Transcript_3738/g.11593  ORF Transcript_3738/g.11593 Transcript_3738/m.11593 type:complete len:258 (+) Transcript_3738:289-1062(+)